MNLQLVIMLYETSIDLRSDLEAFNLSLEPSFSDTSNSNKFDAFEKIQQKKSDSSAKSFESKERFVKLL